MRNASPGGTHPVRPALRIAVCAITCLRPIVVSAAPAAATIEHAEELFQRGHEQSDRGDHLAAARTWTEAARLLPRDDANGRRDLFDYIAEAYEKAATADRTSLEEAVQALDAYATDFAANYPSASLSTHGTEIRTRLRESLEDPAFIPVSPSRPQKDADPTKPATEPVPAESPTPPPPPRPGKRLTIAGGVTIGLGVGMLGMFVGGYARAVQIERAGDDFGCTFPLYGDCRDLHDRGERSEAVARAGLITAPILLAAGITMVVVAHRRSSRQAFAPILHPTMTGAVWHLRF